MKPTSTFTKLFSSVFALAVVPAVMTSSVFSAIQITDGYLRTFSRGGVQNGPYNPLRQRETNTLYQSTLQIIQSQSISTQSAGVNLSGTLQLATDLISFSGNCSPTLDMGVAAVIHFTVSEITAVGFRNPLDTDGFISGIDSGGYAQDILWLTAKSGEVVAGYGNHAGPGGVGSGVYGQGGFWQDQFMNYQGTIAPGDYTLELVAERTGAQPFWGPLFGFEVGFGSNANVPAPSAAPLLALACLKSCGRRRK